VILAVAGVVVVAGVVAAVALGAGAGTEVTTEEATSGELSVTVSASGKVETDERADLYPPAAGTLASIEVTEGASVKAGDTIATLDTGPLEAQVGQAEAAYKAALAQRAAIRSGSPGSTDANAASASVTAGWSAYQAALAAYDAVKSGKPTAESIAVAESAVASAQATYDIAQGAYQSFYDDVYLPAPDPKGVLLEASLAALALVRDQSFAGVLSAQQSLGALLAAGSDKTAEAQAKAARDQAYAAYLGTVAQQRALSKAGDTGAALASAEAAAAAAKTALELAEEALANATMVAPADGVVIFNSISGAIPGGPVIKPAVGFTVSPASAPFSIVAFDTLTFAAQVDEADIARLEVGMAAIVSLDGLPAEAFETRVERIERRSVLTPTGGTAFPVTLRLTGTQGRVLLGMNGSAEVIVETIPATVSVPVEAVLEEGGADHVFVAEDGKARKVPVTLGRLTDTRAEIVSGLEAGAEVIIGGVSELEDGADIRVR
jgi:HlyD family secretion protein